MKKLIPGGKYKTRPSAAYFFHVLRVPLGYEIVYRKKKGGPMVKHTLQMKHGKGGESVPYWKPVKTSSKKSSNRRSMRRRTTRRRTTRRRRNRSRRQSNKRYQKGG